MQQLAYAGCPLMGTQSETLLEIITRRMRCIGRWLKDTLNQRGSPNGHDQNTAASRSPRQREERQHAFPVS